MRVNANGTRIDAWLIYRCTSCDDTWNRPVLERQHVRSIDPLFLRSLRDNDAELACRLAFDGEGLRRGARRLEEFDDVAVLKEVQSQGGTPTRQLDILCAVPRPISLRVDRLVAAELQLSRSRVQRLEENGELAIFPRVLRVLRAQVRDGMRLTINVAAHDARAIVQAAQEQRSAG